jgi:predicted aspartyl protease
VRLRTYICLASLAFLAIAAPRSIANSTPNKPDTTAPPDAELPFQLLAGYLIQVEGHIGTQKHLKFVLDTGASISIIDSRVADKLSLKLQPTETFSFDRRLSWQQATFPEIGFGPTRATQVVMLVGHLADYSDFGRNVDAIIGIDLLKLSNFSIDFNASRIIFHSFNHTPSVASPDPLRNCLFLEMRVHDRPIRLVVDTGFPGILLFEERLVTAVPDLDVGDKHLNVILGGRLRAKETTLRGVFIGSVRRDAAVLLAKAPASDVLPGVVGVIGTSPLRSHKVNFDFIKRTISWE